jgi:hypothetical protein
MRGIEPGDGIGVEFQAEPLRERLPRQQYLIAGLCPGLTA